MTAAKIWKVEAKPPVASRSTPPIVGPRDEAAPDQAGQGEQLQIVRAAEIVEHQHGHRQGREAKAQAAPDRERQQHRMSRATLKAAAPAISAARAKIRI